MVILLRKPPEGEGGRGRYRYPSVAPDLPAPCEYLPFLEAMHERRWYSNFGPLARRFETELGEAFGAAEETCVTASSATAGFSAALIATGRPGPVLVPAFTFPASLGAVRAAGMAPIVVDVDRRDWTLRRDCLEPALSGAGATVVMLVTPFGMRPEFDAEIDLCLRAGAAVVIDNASGLGVRRFANGLPRNVFEVFSMHATKPFAIGEGGAVFAHRAHDEALRAALAFALASHLSPDGPHWGFNGKMSELHAAVGLAQLPRFGPALRRRQEFVARYIDLLAKRDDLEFPKEADRAPWQFFPVLLPSETAVERFVTAAAAVGVEIRRYYRPSLSLWPDAATFGPCDVAEDLADRMCVLPVRSNVEREEAEAIITLTAGALNGAL